MQHFVTVSDLSHEEINILVQRAFDLKKALNVPSYTDATLATLFYENRPALGLVLSLQQKTNHEIVNLNIGTSSEEKGETIEDTFKNLAAMGVNYFCYSSSAKSSSF